MSALPSAVPSGAIIDACVVGAWSFSEKDTSAAQKVMRLVYGGRVTGYVPELFWAEFQQVCRKKWNEAPPVPRPSAEASYTLARNSPLVEIPGVLEELRDQAWDWMKRTNVASYDAYYLALGAFLGLEVWTIDERFWQVVQADADAQRIVKLVQRDPRL